MKTYSFPRGGLLYEDPTAPPANYGVVAFLPPISVIPLVQHTGGKAVPVVSVGDTVREGMLVGKGIDPGSANIHATVPGKVIRLVKWEESEGRVNEALVIRMDGSFDLLGKEEVRSDYGDIKKYELIRILSEYGIVEMEGTGRPVADILSELNGTSGTQTLVVRCVFDDPWLAADYVLLKDRLRAVLEGGFVIAGSDDRIKRILFAVSRSEKKLGQAILDEASRYHIPSSMVLTGSRYPQKNSRELELVLRNYEKKEGINLGKLLVFGPATLAAVYDAVFYRRPVLERYVAVGGSAVRRPRVLRVRIGTRIRDIFEECGGLVDTPCRVATGSPVSGNRVVDLDEPVIKTSYAVFAMLKDQTGDYPERDCISCGECRSVCPVGLDPEELYKQKMLNISAVFPDAGECHGCGCCEVVCPSRLPLSDVITGNRTGALAPTGAASPKESALPKESASPRESASPKESESA